MQEQPASDITKTHFFIGRVEHIIDESKFAIEIVVSNADTGAKYPNSYTFKAYFKSGTADFVKNSVGVGDKVEVRFMCFGKEGTSKAGRYYHFNEFVVMRNGVKVIEHGEARPSEADIPTEDQGGQEDLPF